MPATASHGTLQSPKLKKVSSPSYFGFTTGDTSDFPDSNPGQHARHKWENGSSDARNTPSTVPMDVNPEFEAFRQQSERGQFTLGHGSLAAFSTGQNSANQPLRKASSRPAQDSPISPRSTVQPSGMSKSTGQSDKETTGGKPTLTSFFDIPRRDSPAGMSPGPAAAIDHHNARLSLPGNHLHTPPPDPDRKPATRAETLPDVLPKTGPNMVSSQHFVTLLQSLPENVLLLDIRVAPQYTVSRIRGALNLCIPTTLMKRPSFNTQKLRDTFASDSDRETFSRWRQCSFIAVYDANSNSMKDAQNPVNVLKKFSAEGWNGQGIILKGGFIEVSKSHPSMIERGSNNPAADIVKSPLSISAPAQAVAPVAGGCPMPTSKTAMNPFFNNIRQNMDLLDGVGQLPVAHPAEMTVLSENALPEWIKKAVAEKNNGKLISDAFLAIERAEQKRMQDALNCTVSYGSPHMEKPGKIQVAGVEKGAKNRYNNIFPYDHSRVLLQDIAAGDCDYINANHIKAAYSNKRYIATQAPIPATFNDFWRLVWEQDTRIIVMLTAESEGGQLKSHPYWHTGDYGPLKLKLLSEKRISLEPNATKGQSSKFKRPSMGQRRSTNPLTEAESTTAKGLSQRSSEAPYATVRHFTLSHSNLPFQPMREITQLHYTQWPDFGAPAHPRHLLALIDQTNRYADGRTSLAHPASAVVEPAPNGQRPIVVHCSAGCGRTGTFCTVDSVIDMLNRQRAEGRQDRMDIDTESDDIHAAEWTDRSDVDLIVRTVENFRGQRLSMVQSLRQFVLCYESVLEWVVMQQILEGGLNGKDIEKGHYLS
jgi:tyrosine-protein phosphatase 2/3